MKCPQKVRRFWGHFYADYAIFRKLMSQPLQP